MTRDFRNVPNQNLCCFTIDCSGKIAALKNFNTACKSHPYSMADTPNSLSVELTARPRRLPRLVRWSLLTCGRFMNVFPSSIKKRSTQIFIDCCVAAISVAVAFQLRFDFNVPPGCVRAMAFLIIGMTALRPASVFMFTGYRAIWSFLRVQDLAALIYAGIPPSALLLILRLVAHRSSWIANVPLGVVVLEFVMFSSIAAGARGLRRAAYEELQPSVEGRKRTLVLGTEETLPAALAQVRTVPELEVIGLIAPGAHLQGYEIDRVPIVAEPSGLGTLLVREKVDVLLIADASLDWIADAASLASQFGIELRMLPSAANIMRGEVRLAAPVDADRAFTRHTISVLPEPEVLDSYCDRVVLVTGAGGSIGSELSRQVCNLSISRLLLLDNSENSIFEIENDLRKSAAGIEIVPVVGDIRDCRLLKRLFAQHQPQIVLHAAAHKHVPIMESHPSEAFLNNVIGTREVLDAALEHRAARFVFISSDKAVEPTSVMGATKRMGEMLLQNRARLSRDTCLASVRFGNVVGSRGSVVPIFLKQIAEGGPITLTDERMTRYFMTAGEAVQLVLLASTLASLGEIYTLDMGDPVMIGSLARKLVEMSGLRPEKDVPIEIVGIRPGEKIREALWCDESRISPTNFSRILSVDSGPVPAEFESDIDELEDLARERRDQDVLEKLRAMPIGYRPVVSEAL